MLCCPGKSPGALRVQVGSDDRDSLVIEAHQTELSCIAVNASGSLVATASQHGTVVKVWRACDGQLLHRLRRSARKAAVTSLAFREDDRFLAVASLSPTVHVFRLDRDDIAEECASAPAVSSQAASLARGSADHVGEAGGGDALSSRGTDVVSDVVEVVRGAVVPNYFNDQKSLAQFRIPEMEAARSASGQACVDVRGAHSAIQGPKVGFRGREPMLLVLHYNGVLYEVAFREDPEPGFDGFQDCTYSASSMWFATRHDFRVQGSSAELVAVLGGDEDDGEAWQLL